MLIITDSPDRLKSISFIEADLLKKSHYANFDDIRWHRLRLINHDVIVLMPEGLDISYHLKYIKMSTGAPVIVIDKTTDNIPKALLPHVLHIEENPSRDYFHGCLKAMLGQHLNQKNNLMNSFKQMNVGKFSLNHIQQAAIFSQNLALVSARPDQLKRGLFELLTNAFEHGVYQIGFSLKQELVANQNYFAELNQRMRHPDFQNKFVELLFHHKADGIYLSISDPGPGFDPKPYLQFNRNHADTPSGRGICYAANVCFDQVSYKNNGKTVIAHMKSQMARKSPLPLTGEG